MDRPWHQIISRLWRHPMGAVGTGIVAVAVAVALLASVLAPYSPYVQQNGMELLPPSRSHPLGTDELGRDILSRLIYGTRIAFLVSVVSVLLGTTVGVTAGGLAGFYWGHWIDSSIMRVMDALLAFPSILLAIAVAAVIGPGVLNAALAIGLINIPQFSRISRASILSENSKEYPLAARAIGARDLRILGLHILPNVLSPIIVQATLAMAFAILLEAGLSFLGLGAQPPQPSWGTMLNTSRTYLQQAPWYGIFPGAALSVLLLGFNFLGDALRDTLDPRQRNLF